MPYDLTNDVLPFPLDTLASKGGTVATPFVVGDKSLITYGVNFYVLCMTPDDFTDLVSVVAVGAPIALPDSYNKIWQQINQLAQFPNQIPEDSCMDLCQLILDCINQEASLQQAIAQYSLSSPIPQDAPEVTANLNAELINNPLGCDNDIIFGMTTGFTDLMNQVSTDILEIIVANSSASGRIGDMIEAVPIIGEAPVDDIFQFVESFLNDILDAYNGAYTSQVRDDIRCDLFCLAQPGCTLTLEMARDYFFDKLGESISLDLWDGFLDDLIEISYSGEPAIWAIHLLITQAIIFGGELLGFDVNRLVATIQSLWNDPDSDWDGLCDDCEWTHIIGGAGEAWGNYSSLITGTINTGNNSFDNGGDTPSTYIQFPVGQLDGATVQSIDVKYYQGRNAVTADFILYVNAGVVLIIDAEVGDKDISHTYSPQIDDTDAFRIYIDIGLSGGFTSGIYEIEFHGLGVNPFL